VRFGADSACTFLEQRPGELGVVFPTVIPEIS